jgi:hypothetical protein
MAFSVRKFTDPAFLHTIAPQYLAAFLAPWRAHLEGRGMTWPADGSGEIDREALSLALMDGNHVVPTDLIDSLYYVYDTASEEHMDALIDHARLRGLVLGRDLLTTTADIAIQIWLADPDMLREQHAQAVALRQKDFLYYGGAHGGRREFPTLHGDLKRKLEETLDDWFEEHRRGRGSRVFTFPHRKKIWILVRHGRSMRREAAHRDDGQSASAFYRPQQDDVLIYDTSSDEIGVHATSKGETRLYLSVFGRLLFASEDYFPPFDKFTLDPLVENGAGSLLCEDVDGLEEIRLVEYRRFWGGAHSEMEIRKASDIFAALAARGQELSSKGRLVGADFKVKFKDAPKERSVKIRPPRNARYERNEDSELIEVWLAKRGFILDPKADSDDDDAPSAVLASA